MDAKFSLTQAQCLNSLEEFYKLLSISRNSVIELLSKPDKLNYNSFAIPKKRIGHRLIQSPVLKLKLLQKKMNAFLQSLYYEINDGLNCHGFIANKSIKTNALPHINKNFVLNLDLKNFFQSIAYKKIVKVLSEDPFLLNPEISILIAQICCYNNFLAQGSPTSPILSNIVCINLDKQLTDLSDVRNLIYSRYADDLTFSSNCSDINYMRESLLQITKVIKNEGFIVNEDKTRILQKTRSQVVTGLVVNNKLSVRRGYLRNIRAILHSFKNSSSGGDAREKYLASTLHYKRDKEVSIEHSIRSKIEYIGFIMGKNNRHYLRLQEQFKQIFAEDQHHKLKDSFQIDFDW